MSGLEELLGHTSMPGTACAVLRHDELRDGLDDVTSALAAAPSGSLVAYAVPLNTPVAQRLLTLVSLRYQLWRIGRRVHHSGGVVVGVYGVDPDLETAAIVFELNTAASDYADRCFRPVGRAQLARRWAARMFGCDPSLGGVLMVWRKL